MLTRDLVQFSVRKGRITPRFLARADPDVCEGVNQLVSLAHRAIGLSQDEVSESITIITQTFKRPKVGKGLAKLLTDAMSVQEPGDAPMALRECTFAAAMDALAKATPTQSEDTFVGAVVRQVIDDGCFTLDEANPAEDLRHRLHADLPRRRMIEQVEISDPDVLMDRYDLAIAQGLVMYSQSLELEIPDMERPEVRRLLRFMRFCRLVAHIERTSDGCRLQVEGPVRLFEGAKAYGLQLASFLSVIPTLPKWRLSAEVHWPRREPAQLELSHKHGLSSRFSGGAGHVPEAMTETIRRIQWPGWSVDTAPAPKIMGASSLAVPDFALVSEDGRQIVVELFHPFHRGALERRLVDLEVHPEAGYRLGVDKALLKDAALAQRVEAHPQAFQFRKFPSLRVLKTLIDAVE